MNMELVEAWSLLCKKEPFFLAGCIRPSEAEPAAKRIKSESTFKCQKMNRLIFTRPVQVDSVGVSLLIL